MPSLTRQSRKTAPAASETPVLDLLRQELQPVEVAPEPTIASAIRGWLWVRRRSHGVPLAVAALVWAIGRLVIEPAGVPAWLVAIAGWLFVAAVYVRAKPAHRTHTVACAVFAAAWLFLVAF